MEYIFNGKKCHYFCANSLYLHMQIFFQLRIYGLLLPQLSQWVQDPAFRV